MSYNISIKAPTVAAALTQLEAEFDDVVQEQPQHALDRAAAVATATAICGLMTVSEEEHDVGLAVDGWVGAAEGATEGATEFIAGVNLTVRAMLIPKPAEA